MNRIERSDGAGAWSRTVHRAPGAGTTIGRLDRLEPHDLALAGDATEYRLQETG